MFSVYAPSIPFVSQQMVLDGHTDKTRHKAVPAMLAVPALSSLPPPTTTTVLAAVVGPLHPMDVPSTPWSTPRRVLQPQKPTNSRITPRSSSELTPDSMPSQNRYEILQNLDDAKTESERKWECQEVELEKAHEDLAQELNIFDETIMTISCMLFDKNPEDDSTNFTTLLEHKSSEKPLPLLPPSEFLGESSSTLSSTSLPPPSTNFVTIK